MLSQDNKCDSILIFTFVPTQFLLFYSIITQGIRYS